MPSKNPFPTVILLPRTVQEKIKILFLIRFMRKVLISHLVKMTAGIVMQMAAGRTCRLKFIRITKRHIRQVWQTSIRKQVSALKSMMGILRMVMLMERQTLTEPNFSFMQMQLVRRKLPYMMLPVMLKLPESIPSKIRNALPIIWEAVWNIIWRKRLHRKDMCLVIW